MPGRYLVTGVAGSGKSTLKKYFQEAGFVTADVDDGFAQWRHIETDEPLEYNPDDESWHRTAEWVVDTNKLQELFNAYPEDIVLVFGSFARQERVVNMFSKIFLLSYPDQDTARARIAGRNDGYGKHPYELAKILSWIQPYEEKMKSFGAEVIDCTLPIDKVAERIKAGI